VLIVGLVLVVLGGSAVVLHAQDSSHVNATAQLHQDEINKMEAARQAAFQAYANNPATPPSIGQTFAPASSPEPWPQGLIQTGNAPFPSAEFIGENVWQWDLNGHHVQVYAGRNGNLGGKGGDSGRGLIIVLATSFDLKPLPLGGSYQAPSGTGSLHIVSYDGALLTLHATTGETFYFDADTQAFTDAAGNPVPTDTPWPTPAPQPTPGATIPFPFPTDTAGPQVTSDARTPTPAPTPGSDWFGTATPPPSPS
jgi:hypothetical protein